MASRLEGTNPRANRSNPRSAGKPAPGFLKCHGCRTEYDPNKGQIRGRGVLAAYCNDCLEANFKAGRWQETFKYEAAKQGGSTS